MTRLFSRSRAFRVAFYLAMVPAWVIVGLISINSLGKYTEVGNVVLLLLIVSFAAWAWWYGEDRDRRARLKEEQAATSTDSDQP
jgi:hypothetical protein